MDFMAKTGSASTAPGIGRRVIIMADAPVVHTRRHWGARMARMFAWKNAAEQLMMIIAWGVR